MTETDAVQTFVVSKDAFSSGQISSKLWLCDHIEKLKFSKPPVVWIYGGWHAMTAFLLLSRQRISIDSIRSFDIDPEAEKVADLIMENWVWQKWKFKAFTVDCNKLNHDDHQYGQPPDLIINTSTEHFTSISWFDSIPSGKTVAIQSNNMPHHDHHTCYDSLDGFLSDYSNLSITYSGQLDIAYPDWNFSRYMIIGRT